MTISDESGPDKEGNFGFLLAGLLGLLIFMPLHDQFFPDLADNFYLFAFTWILVLGVWSIRGRRIYFWIGMSLTVAVVVLTVIAIKENLPWMVPVIEGLVFLFCALSLFKTVTRVFGSRRVSANTLMGAMCVYLLLGILWSFIYLALYAIAPESFTGTGLPPGIPDNPATQFIYYSFVTLTTLGYGDIVPSTPMARSIVNLQVIIAQFYLAILVGSLVGRYVAHSIMMEKDR